MKRYASRSDEYLPSAYYNLKADLPDQPPPPLHPGTREPLGPQDLLPLFPEGFIRQEASLERFIPIPDKFMDAYAAYRPTPAPSSEWTSRSSWSASAIGRSRDAVS